jgi:hypothetical protein
MLQTMARSFMRRDDVDIAGRGDEDVGARRGFFHRRDLIAFHRGLQGADRIDLGDQHAAAGIAQARGRTLADVAEAGDHRHLARHHHVGAAADAVDQRLAAAVEIVEFRLCDGIIDVDRRPKELALLLHDVKAMHARGRLLGDALDGLGVALVETRIGLEALLDRREQDLFFLVRRLVEEGDIAALGAQAKVNEQSGVAAIVEDHVRAAAIGPLENAMGVIPIILEALALDGEHRRAGGGDGGGGVILGRINVAGSPANIGAERLQRLDQHARLNGHMERARDTRALERLAGAVFGARRHQTGHFGLGNVEFLAAPIGESDVGDDIIVEMSGHDLPFALMSPDVGPARATSPRRGYSKGFRATQ